MSPGLRALMAGFLPAIASRGANAVLAFASAIVAARALGPEPYGVYALAVSVLMLLALAAQLGLDNLTTRNLGIYVHGSDWAQAFSYLRWTTKLVLLSSAAVYAGATLVLSWNPMGWTATEVLATRVILIGLPFLAMLRLSRGRLQGLDATSTGIFYEMPFWNGLLLLSGALILAVPPLQTSLAMAALHVASCAVAFLGAHVAVRRRLPARPAEVPPPSSSWRRSGLVFTAVGVLTLLLSQGDILLIGSILTPAETGSFSVAARSAGLTLILLQPIQQVVAPKIARAWSDGDATGAARLARRCARLSLLAGIPVALGFWLFGAFFLTLFGSGFGDALWALRWLTLAQVLLTAFGPGALVLQMIHEERASLAILAVAVLVGLPLSALMAVWYGITGVAFAKVFVLVGMGLASYVALRRRAALDVSPFASDRSLTPP